MNFARCLILIGGLLLLGGLVTALLAARYQSRVMGDAALGVAVWAPEKGSAEWDEKQRLRRTADFWFWVGIVLTALGVAFQTIGGLLA